jgi:hypothetical protein
VCAFFHFISPLTLCCFLSVLNYFFQYKGMIYRVELMHFLVFHSLNHADLPDELDVYRLGGRKID